MQGAEPHLPPHEPDDRLLMALIRAGRRDAFEKLVQRHQQPLLNFFARMGAHRDAEDMTQETFVRLYRYRDRYRPAAKFTTFLYTVARHVWLDGYRKARRRGHLLDALKEETTPAADHGANRIPHRMDVRGAVERLPEKLRAVVVLSAWQGLQHHEIATILRIPEGTVKSRMFLAMNLLRKELGHDGTASA